jgi:hypothetical protein
MKQKPKIDANDLLTNSSYFLAPYSIEALKPIGISLSRFTKTQV